MIKAIFNYSGSEDMFPELFSRSGQEVTILRALTQEEADINDIGPMYKIQFKDGVVHEAFQDELIFI